MKYLKVFFTLLLFVLSGCTTSYQQQPSTDNLDVLHTLTQQSTSSNQPNIGRIRLKALKNTALTIGAQGALAWRSKQINMMLNQDSNNLSRIFNFNGLMLDHSVLPPVLEQSDQSLNLSDPNTIRVSDHTYKIIKQARFVTTSPNWRQYLRMNFKRPAVPNSTLLPKNKREREIWIKYVNIGWEKGIEQANNIFSDNLASLHRDFNGIILYRQLLAQHIVSKPFVARSKMGITSNASHTEMRINDQILRITALPTLNPNSKQWQPALITRPQ